jgi:transposase
MEKIARIGLDTSKHVFQLHGVNGAEQTVLKKKLRRSDLAPFFKALAPTVVALEACGASHHWARLLGSLGHEVRLIAPLLVRPYVKRGKNDAADAEAICEAMSRPTMRFVPVKSSEQQASLMLVGVRQQLVRMRTQLANAIRGYAAEFGLITPRGMCKIEPLLDRVAGDPGIPELARDLFALQAQQYAALQEKLEALEAKLKAWHRANECSRRLAEIPGVGPIGAALLQMKTPAPQLFASGRQFAAWIGLTPRDHSTAGKARPGAITRAGDEMLRANLVSGATALLRQVRAGQIRGAPRWVVELLQRKPPKLAAVAMANKIARIAWKLMISGDRYVGEAAPAVASAAA